MYKMWNLWGSRYITVSLEGFTPNFSLSTGYDTYDRAFYFHLTIGGANLSMGTAFSF